MRNLQQYPITQDEKISAVQHAIEAQQATAKIGDIRPAALAAVLRDLTNAGEPAEPLFKDLDWQCGNWWYAHTIIGSYHYKNWWMDINGAAWLHFPDGSSAVPCKSIEEAKAKAMAHFSQIVKTALIEKAARVVETVAPNDASPSPSDWQDRLSNLLKSLQTGQEIELQRIMVKVNPPSVEDLTEEIKKRVAQGSVQAIHRIYSPDTRIPLIDLSFDTTIPAEYEDECVGETVKLDLSRDVELIVSAPSDNT